MIIQDKYIYIEGDAGEAAKKWIDEYFYLIEPHAAGKGMHASIHIPIDIWWELDEKVRKQIKECHWLWGKDNDVWDLPEDATVEDKWFAKYKYHAQTKLMVFQFTLEEAWVVDCRCKYGHDGMEESWQIHFIDVSYLDPIIYKNFNRYPDPFLVSVAE